MAFLKCLLTLKSVAGYCIASSWISHQEALLLLPEVFRSHGNELAREKLGCWLLAAPQGGQQCGDDALLLCSIQQSACFWGFAAFQHPSPHPAPWSVPLSHLYRSFLCVSISVSIINTDNVTIFMMCYSASFPAHWKQPCMQHSLCKAWLDKHSFYSCYTLF